MFNSDANKRKSMLPIRITNNKIVKKILECCLSKLLLFYVLCQSQLKHTTEFVIIIFMNNNLRAFAFKLRLIQVTLFDPNQQDAYFTLSIINKHNQYNTSPFLLVNKIIDLKQCAPISINIDQGKNSLVRIVLNSCNENTHYETQIDYKIIDAVVNQSKKPEAKRKKHILAFPLFGRSRTVIGELKIKISISDHNLQLSQSTHKHNQRKLQRKLVFSQCDGQDYFQVAYSGYIKIKIDNFQVISQQNENIKQEQVIEKPNEKKLVAKNDNFEPFKEQISQIQMVDSNSGRLNEQQQCQIVDFTNNVKSEKDIQSNQPIEQNQDIPQDCRYLFQKINQINKRYAPLQRIPSEQQFSQDSCLNQQQCKIQPELDLSSDQISHPLQQVQQLLKQLDLIKFAQTLQQVQASKS